MQGVCGDHRANRVRVSDGGDEEDERGHETMEHGTAGALYFNDSRRPTWKPTRVN